LSFSGFNFVLIKFPSAIGTIGVGAPGFHTGNAMRCSICGASTRCVFAGAALSGDTKVDQISHAATRGIQDLLLTIYLVAFYLLTIEMMGCRGCPPR
jgi:hypothetical protein